MAEDQDKYEALIEKHAQREMAIKEITESRIKKEQNSTKQITVKIFPNTHKALKLMATAKDTSLEKIATSIIESKVNGLDIIKYVKDAIDNSNEFEEGYDWLQREDIDNSTYDLNDKLLNKGNPRKRINVKVDPDTHKKLRVISAIQDRSLDNIVGSVIEYELGEENNINASKLMDEILDSIEDEE